MIQRGRFKSVYLFHQWVKILTLWVHYGFVFGGLLVAFCGFCLFVVLLLLLRFLLLGGRGVDSFHLLL